MIWTSNYEVIFAKKFRINNQIWSDIDRSIFANIVWKEPKLSANGV